MIPTPLLPPKRLSIVLESWEEDLSISPLQLSPPLLSIPETDVRRPSTDSTTSFTSTTSTISSASTISTSSTNPITAPAPVALLPPHPALVASPARSLSHPKKKTLTVKITNPMLSVPLKLTTPRTPHKTPKKALIQRHKRSYSVDLSNDVDLGLAKGCRGTPHHLKKAVAWAKKNAFVRTNSMEAMMEVSGYEGDDEEGYVYM